MEHTETVHVRCDTCDAEFDVDYFQLTFDEHCYDELWCEDIETTYCPVCRSEQSVTVFI